MATNDNVKQEFEQKSEDEPARPSLAEFVADAETIACDIAKALEEASRMIAAKTAEEKQPEASAEDKEEFVETTVEDVMEILEETALDVMRVAAPVVGIMVLTLFSCRLIIKQ